MRLLVLVTSGKYQWDRDRPVNNQTTSPTLGIFKVASERRLELELVFEVHTSHPSRIGLRVVSKNPLTLAGKLSVLRSLALAAPSPYAERARGGERESAEREGRT
jgi:hypothetical protein